MRYVIPVYAIISFITGCDTCNLEPNKIPENIDSKEFIKPISNWDNLNLDIGIELNDSIFSLCDSIKMKVKLTNMQATAQRFLFDKPKGNNQTHLEITDINGTSVLHAYWRELSSHMWLEEELDPFYYLLQPNHSIVREFYLEEIAVIRNPDIEGGLNSMLKDGIYTLRIKFGKNYSNIQKFTIQKKSKGN